MSTKITKFGIHHDMAIILKIIKRVKSNNQIFKFRKSILQLVIVSFSISSLNISKASADETKSEQNSKLTSVNAAKSKKIIFKQVPSVKPGEFTYFYNEDYQIFTTQKINNIAYSHHCFKTKKPDCEAIRLSTLNNITIKLTNPEMQNYASAYCSEIYGKNMIAFDHEKKEYNFCRFQDGSLVASWALYKAKNPKINVDYK